MFQVHMRRLYQWEMVEAKGEVFTKLARADRIYLALYTKDPLHLLYDRTNVMSHHQDRQVFSKLDEQAMNLSFGLYIDVCCGLIEKEDARL